MIDQNKNQLDTYLTTDARGKLVPDFLQQLSQCLADEQSAMLIELNTLSDGVDHIREIIAAQQTLARGSTVLTPTDPAQLMENALTMQGGSLERHGIAVERRFEKIESVPLDTHRILQILINLISNAKHAVKAFDGAKKVTLVVATTGAGDERKLRFQVIDTGCGIAPENATKIFSHGFTTKKDGHGFGLHSAANAAKEMGGSLSAFSDGPGTGATFTLELPVNANRPGRAASEKWVAV
jgi:signal transduction histidine kinase